MSVLGKIGESIDASKWFENPNAEAAAKNAQDANRMSKKYWKATKQVRNPVLDRLGEFMQGGLDPASSLLFAPQKLAIEQQYNTALDNMLANLPAGGAIGDQMAQIEMGRAGSLSGMIAQLLQDEYNKAYGVAVGSPQQTFQGLGTAAQSYAPGTAGQSQLLSSIMSTLPLALI